MGVDFIPTQETAYANNYLINFQNVQNCAGFTVPTMVQQPTPWNLPFGLNSLQQFNQFANPQFPTLPAAPLMVPQIQVPPAFTVNSTLGASPQFQPAVSPSLSPAFVGTPEYMVIANSPSPSPNFASSPVQNLSVPMENLNLGASVQNIQNEPMQVEAVQNVEVDPQCETFFELPIIKHQATVQSISHEHGAELADAMRYVLGLDIHYLFVRVMQTDKAMTIQWCAHPGYCDFQAILALTRAKDFEKKLICRLARVGGGDFNRHLHGSKQLTIVNEGYRLVEKLGHALMSFNDNLDHVLGVAEQDQFDQANKDALFDVCKAPKGQALRGQNVVGAHFRGGDVLKLVDFVETVESVIGEVRKATMIPSMKGKAQYKGWSVYIETPSNEHVRAIMSACEQCSFQKVEIFTAVDKFQK
jgi:hypothetical protein